MAGERRSEESVENKIRMTIYVDEELFEKIKNLSKEESRSRSAQVEKLLKDYFSKHAENADKYETNESAV